MKWLVRGDWDGFLGLGLDNVVQLLIVVSLCGGVLGFAPDLIYGRILPAIAISYLSGNFLYARMAMNLARRTGRTDVCALPFGLNTPLIFAFGLFIMLPALQLAKARGVVDPLRMAWQIGMAACFLSGLIEVLIAFIAAPLRRFTPRAAMLSTLAGIGLALLAMSLLFRATAHPIVGITTLFVMFLVAYGKVGFRFFRFQLSGILLLIFIGVALCWATGIAPHGPSPRENLGVHLPVPMVGEIWAGFTQQSIIPYLSIILPMSLLGALSSLQNIESAEAAGDSYNARNALLINGVGTMLGACFGSPFPLTIYIGHPGWKSLGARAGYSVLNGVFILLLCLTGATALLAWFVPEDAGLAVVIWIGLAITLQAFDAVPSKHKIAVVVGLMPALAAWVALMLKTILRAVGPPPHPLFTPDLVALLQQNDFALEGIFALEQGFVYTATIWAAMLVYIVERRFRVAAIWSGIAMILSLLGFMHAWKFSFLDTVLNMPLLDWLCGMPLPTTWAEIFPAWPFALGYGLVALLLLASHYFGVETEAHEA